VQSTGIAVTRTDNVAPGLTEIRRSTTRLRPTRAVPRAPRGSTARTSLNPNGGTRFADCSGVPGDEVFVTATANVVGRPAGADAGETTTA